MIQSLMTGLTKDSGLDPHSPPARPARTRAQGARTYQRRREASVSLVVGGWPTQSSSDYSVLGGPASCPLALPPLPRQGMWDPSVELVKNILVTCSINYDKVTAPHYTSREGMACWGLALGTSQPWRALSPPPRTRFLAASASLGSRLLLIGGSKSMTPGMVKMTGTTTVQILHLASGKWARGRPLPAPVFSACAVRLPHGVLVVGDFEAGSTNAYILKRGKWTPLPPSLHPHEMPTCVRVSLGGEEVAAVASGNQVEFYSPSAGEWRALPRPLVDRAAHPRPSLGVSKGGSLLLAGGFDMEELEESTVVEVWHEAEGRWEVQARLETGRTRQGEVVVPAKLLCP